MPGPASYYNNANHVDIDINGKTPCDIKVEGFYTNYSFLLEEQILDINIPLHKMKKLKFLEEYDSENRKELRKRLPFFNKRRMFCNTKTNEFREVAKSEKKAICLHFPAGWDSGVHTSANENSSGVNYYVHRNGTILEYGEPELWDHHSSCGSHNKNVIAIEIVNVGPLELRGDKLFTTFGTEYCSLDSTLEGHNKAYIDLENNKDYDPRGNNSEGTFRGYRYFAAWTTDQMQSLKKLLKALCKEYKIPYTFLPHEYRFKYFPGLGYWKPRQLGKWCVDAWNDATKDFDWLIEKGYGIISHVNTAIVIEEQGHSRETDKKSIAKWDIGPAFDWNYLENNLKTAYPYQSHASAQQEPNPLYWFDNPELWSKGGYFPIGRNGTAHAGMHLFAPSGTSQAVYAMTDGYVVAFRFYSEEQRGEQENNRPEELRNLTNPTHSGFVLLRHDFSIEDEEADVQSFYSLYMDLQPPADDQIIPWVDQLKKLSKGCSLSLSHENLGKLVPDGTEGVYARPPMDVLAHLDFDGNIPIHSSNEHGVISLSEPWLMVTCKEVIGYTSSLSGEPNYCHWEVFATEKEAFTSLAEHSEGFSFEEVEEAADGIFSPDELNSLLSPEENRYKKPFLGIGAPHYSRNGENIPLAEHLKDLYSQNNEMPYTLNLKLEDSPAYTLKSDLNFQFQHMTSEGVVINPETIDFSTAELQAGASMEVNSTTHLLRVTPPPFISDFQIKHGSSHSLFLDVAQHGGLLRNSLLSMHSPWSEDYLKKIIDALILFHYITSTYSFNMADLTVLNLFSDKQEETVFDPVFGSGAFIDPNQPIHAVHPALFLWMLRLVQDSLRNRNESMIDCENPLKQYGFSLSDGSTNLLLGDKVKLLVLAEHNRPGIPYKRDSSENRILKVAKNRSVVVDLDKHGVFIHELQLNSWGKYEISELGAIPNLKSTFTVPEPSWDRAELTAEKRVRFYGLEKAPSPTHFICSIKGCIGSAPAQFTHYLLIGNNIPSQEPMDCDVNPSNTESFIDVLVVAIEQAHMNNNLPVDASWKDLLTVTPRLYNGGVSFIEASDDGTTEPDQFNKGYFLSEDDMKEAPDEYIEKGALTLPERKLEQSCTITHHNTYPFVWLRQQVGQENRLDSTEKIEVYNSTEVTLFLNPLSGDRIRKNWSYDSKSKPVDFYLVKTPEGKLGWIYCSRVV